MSSYPFGITPTYAFEDVSALMAGESVVLATYAYDMSDVNFLTMSANTLNNCVSDVEVDADLSALIAISANVEALSNTDLAVDPILVARLKAMAENSAKATIAKKITGNAFGDIGELENDVYLSGENLFVEDTFKAAIIAAIKANNGDAIVSVAEDIINNEGICGVSGTNTGRDTEAPFQPTDLLMFNMVLCNGNITLRVDSAHASLTGVDNGMTYFTAPLADTEIGTEDVAAFDVSSGDRLVNASAGSNVYLDGDTGNSRGANAVSLRDGSGDGYVTGDSGVYTSGAVIGRFALTLN